MIKCEKCLYRKNCQFLATHKNTTVEGCTAFESESDFKIEAVKELLEKIEKQAILSEDDVYWVELDDIYNLVKEMVGENNG